MPERIDLETLESQKFFSESQNCFVEIKDGILKTGKNNIDLSVCDTQIDNLVKDLLSDSRTKYRLRKRKSHAFRKDVYLLAEDEEGYTYWLEEPKWDCDWYWGFGYIETYTNNSNPAKARDITSHQHFSSFIGHQEYWDSEKVCWVVGEYIHNVYDNPVFVETTFSHDEGWKLTELFTQFYLLQKMAAFCHKERPGCHVTTSSVDHGNMKDWYDHINKTMIPKVTAEIIKILSPEERDDGRQDKERYSKSNESA